MKKYIKPSIVKVELENETIMAASVLTLDTGGSVLPDDARGNELDLDLGDELALDLEESLGWDEDL